MKTELISAPTTTATSAACDAEQGNPKLFFKGTKSQSQAGFQEKPSMICSD